MFNYIIDRNLIYSYKFNCTFAILFKFYGHKRTIMTMMSKMNCSNGTLYHMT